MLVQIQIISTVEGHSTIFIGVKTPILYSNLFANTANKLYIRASQPIRVSTSTHQRQTKPFIINVPFKYHPFHVKAHYTPFNLMGKYQATTHLYPRTNATYPRGVISIQTIPFCGCSFYCILYLFLLLTIIPAAFLSPELYQ